MKTISLFLFLSFFLTQTFSQNKKDTSFSSYKRMIDTVQNGKIAPDFKYVKNTGDSVRLSSFKGKYVVMDLWATWCGPCKAEIPRYENLQEVFADDNIVFISISIDDDKQAWKNFVEERKLKGVQVWAGGKTKPPAFYYTIIDGKEFNLPGYGSGVPVFVLIGPDGKIINKSAPRPSDGLEELLNEQKGLKK